MKCTLCCKPQYSEPWQRMYKKSHAIFLLRKLVAISRLATNEANGSYDWRRTCCIFILPNKGKFQLFWEISNSKKIFQRKWKKKNKWIIFNVDIYEHVEYCFCDLLAFCCCLINFLFLKLCCCLWLRKFMGFSLDSDWI